jgi:hypothetical protein
LGGVVSTINEAALFLRPFEDKTTLLNIRIFTQKLLLLSLCHVAAIDSVHPETPVLDARDFWSLLVALVLKWFDYLVTSLICSFSIL